jgi:hypothetical protein
MEVDARVEVKVGGSISLQVKRGCRTFRYKRIRAGREDTVFMSIPVSEEVRPEGLAGVFSMRENFHSQTVLLK